MALDLIVPRLYKGKVGTDNLQHAQSRESGLPKESGFGR
jgi:hypothetical protein